MRTTRPTKETLQATGIVIGIGILVALAGSLAGGTFFLLLALGMLFLGIYGKGL